MKKAFIFDLDGTLTPHRGSAPGSLFDIAMDKNYKLYPPAELEERVERYIQKIGTDKHAKVIDYLKSIDGSVHIVTYNYEAVARLYLKGVTLGPSIFQPNEKAEEWLDLLKEIGERDEYYYFDDDEEDLEAIKAVDPGKTIFTHVKEWMGEIRQ